MGGITDIFGGGGGGGGGDDSGGTVTTTNNNNSNGFWDNWLQNSMNNGSSATQDYQQNFVYQQPQSGSQGQINSVNSLASLMQGLVASPYSTVSGYQPLAYNLTNQPRMGLYSMNNYFNNG